MVMALDIAFLCLFISSATCSTHWVVTEEGKLQEQLESPFAINQPHDLMAFVKQETNYEKMQQLKDILVIEKNSIEENEDKELDLEEKHYRTDEDCIAAGKQLSDFDLFVSTVLPMENKDIKVSDHIDFTKPEEGSTLLKPDCVKAFDLPQGQSLYDNLLGVKNRKYLHMYQAETGLQATLKYMDNEEELANAIELALRQNSSSWVAYNLATSLWRLNGNAERAIECIRRALHFSPSHYKDVALVSLANILHRSDFSANASAVLEDALEIESIANVVHFTLASIYAALGQAELAMKLYEKTLETQPGFTAAKKRLHAVKCQYNLKLKFEAQHESLQRTLRELEAYQEKHKKYVDIYKAVDKMQLKRQDQINMHFLLMQYMIKDNSFDHRRCKYKNNELICTLPTPGTGQAEAGDETELGPNIGKDVFSHFIPGSKAATFSSDAATELLKESAPTDGIPVGDWSNPMWPTEEHCNVYAPKTLAWDEYPSTYLDPESRGFRVRDLLTSYIGIKEGQNAPRPWSDLNCKSLEPSCEDTALDELPGMIDRHKMQMHKPDEYMNQVLLMHVNKGRVWPGDLVHRIHTAIKKSLSGKDEQKNLWFLYNYAGLYFRVTGDNLKALECLRCAMHRTPEEHKDITLLNVANIMYRLGNLDDALALLIDAIVTNRTEPVLYLAMGNVLQAKGNVSGAVTFYEYGLHLDQQYRADFYALINVKCASLRKEKSKEKFGIEATDTKHLPQSLDSCDGDLATCIIHSKLVENLKNSKDPACSNQEMEESASGNFLFASQEPRAVTDCENISDEGDLVRRLQSTKDDADRILQDADAVIQRLSQVAKSSDDELNTRVSMARKTMKQLSQMRESLGSLVEEASSSVDTANSLFGTSKFALSYSECTLVLRDVDLRTYLSSSVDVSVRGYDFTEELPGVKAIGRETSEPHCLLPSSSQQYNVDNLGTVANRERFLRYDKEREIEQLLRHLIPSEGEDEDLSIISRRLAEGMLAHPASWRISFLSSYYWRLNGKAKEAIDCLRLSLSTAPLEMRDVILISLANLFAQLRQWKDAIYVANQAILVYPDYFLNHFTLANILAAMGDIPASIPSYRRTLELQPDFDVAQRRLEAALCEGNRIH